MVNTNNGGTNLDSENTLDKKENAKDDKKVDLYEKLYEEFFETQKNKESFLDILFNDKNTLLLELKKFKNINDKYKNLDDEKISLLSLQINNKNKYLELKNLRKDIENNFLKIYDVNGDFFTKNLKKDINLLSPEELKNLLDSKNMDEFLSKKLGNKKPELRIFKASLKNIFGNINYAKLNKEQQEDVKAIMTGLDTKYKNSAILNLDDDDIISIISLFQYKALDDKLKKDFLKLYFPKFSLRDKKKLFNLSDEDISKEKLLIIKNNFPYFEDLDQSDKDLFVKSINEEDLFLETSSMSSDELTKLFSNNSNFIEIGKGYKEFYNRLGKDLKNKIEESELKNKGIESDGNGLNTQKFIESLGVIKKISNSQNFKEGNVICLNTLKKEEVPDGIGGVKTEEFTNTIYLKIKSIDENKKVITFYDFGSIGLYKENFNNEIKMDFQTFLYFVEKGATDNGDKVSSGIIYTPDELQLQINKGIVKVDKDILIQKSLDGVYNANEREEIIEMNYASLLNSINEIDSEGKPFGLDRGTTFTTNNGSYFTVDNNVKSENCVRLYSPFNSDVEEYSYEDFYKGFKKNETKRKSNVVDIDSMFVNLNDELDSWNGFKLNSNKKIVKKSTNEEKGKNQTGIEYDYLVADKGIDFIGDCNILKIDNISGDDVFVRLGNLEEQEDKKDKKNSKKIFSMGKETFKIKMSTLESWIKKAKMRPESLDSYKDVIEEEYETFDRKGNMFSRFFSKTSFNEIVKGGKFWLESVKSYLNEGNEEHAAKFADSYLGKLLPKGMQYDIKSRLESAQKKRMEDYKQRLKDLDSGPATELVFKWLKNKNSSEPQKEAAMIFMMESYGSLYTKKALFQHRGKWLWYEAMGGKAGDKLFHEQKERAEKMGIQFTEEDLIYSLISKQCKGELHPYRRGRLYKEVEALIGKGREEEFEKGKKDASKKRTVDFRVDFALGELGGGSYPNAMGAFEEIVSKGDDGNMTTLNKLPFVMAFSGLAYDFDQKMVDGFKNNPASGRPVFSTMFMSKTALIDLFSETVLELSRDLGKIHGGDYKDMEKDALIIFNKQREPSSPTQKVKDTVAFFDKYGEVLTRSMNMLMTGKADDLSKTDQIIFLKKDEHGKGIYKRYYNTFKTFTDSFSDFTNEGNMTDAFTSDNGSGFGSGIIGMDTFKISKDTLLQAQGGGFRLKDSGPNVWKGFVHAMDEVKKTNYSESEEENREIKTKIIKDKLSGLLGGLLQHHGSNQNALRGLMDQGTSSFFTKFNEWGIKSQDFVKQSITADRIMDPNDKAAETLLNRYIDNILDGKKVDEIGFSISNVTDEVRKSVINNSESD